MEEKRRLPSWMIGASTANKVSKTIDLDAEHIITKEEVNVATKSTKPLKTRNHKKQVSPSSNDKTFLVKCQTKRKKRATDEKEAIESHDLNQEAIVEKKKLRRVRRKVEESHDSRNKKEDNPQSSDEDDEDLTMDDLLTIAKQFVENDKKSSEELLKRNSSHSSSSSVRSTNSIIAPQDTKPPIQEHTASHYVNTTMTGDPAQDMLDLLLGPLLKKPIRKEESSSIQDMIIPHEVKNQKHEDAAVFNKPVNFAKKKSSLRDAVALLLD